MAYTYHLIPWLKERTQQTFYQKIRRFCWLSESELQSAIETLTLPDALQIAYQAMGKEHRVKLSTTDSNTLDSAVQTIKSALAHFYLNDQDQALKTMVFEKCKQLGVTVALAESCTGGAVSAALTSLPGSSAVVIVVLLLILIKSNKNSCRSQNLFSFNMELSANRVPKPWHKELDMHYVLIGVYRLQGLQDQVEGV